MSGVQAEDNPVTPDLSVLAEPLVAAARTQGAELTGSGGLLTGLTKRVLETVLDVELSHHLGALTELGTSRSANPGRSP
jgi:transposase-like protein